MTTLAKRYLGTAVMTLLVACSGRSSVMRSSEAEPAGNFPIRVIPTVYRAGRFFAAPVTTHGDTLTLLLDTGDNSRLWDAFAAAADLELATTTVLDGAQRPPRAAPYRVARLPSFLPSASVPNPSLNAGRIEITPPQDAFDTLMSRVTVGQLGADWFADRVWTLDYPGHRLVLHENGASPAGPDDHQTPLGFPTDSTGRRRGHVPRIAVVIDGD